MAHLFTSESVSEGHPDKIADQISDALLDEFLRQDPDSKVAIEALTTTGLVVLGGEVNTRGYVDVQRVAREVIRRIGYTRSDYKFDADSCGVLSAIHEQSADIRRGVDRGSEETQGAGDQGMMFGYATSESDNYMPLSLELSHLLLKELAALRRENEQITYLRPDSKAQVTIQYNGNVTPEKVHTIVLSTQHDPFNEDEKMLKKIRADIIQILIPRVREKLPERIRRLFGDDIIYHVNPTGKFVIGGPHGDTGLTGRKIIVDTYGGKGPHGGGSFSGKDASKVDRSAAYAVRHIAKNLVAAGVADEVIVQVAYAIGVAEPVGLYVNTLGTSRVKISESEIARRIRDLFDLRPGAIIRHYGLKKPIFFETAAYGHMGRTTFTKEVEVCYNGKSEKISTEFFPWEKLDRIEDIRKTFKLERAKA